MEKPYSVWFIREDGSERLVDHYWFRNEANEAARAFISGRTEGHTVVIDHNTQRTRQYFPRGY